MIVEDNDQFSVSIPDYLLDQVTNSEDPEEDLEQAPEEEEENVNENSIDYSLYLEDITATLENIEANQLDPSEKSY